MLTNELINIWLQSKNMLDGHVLEDTFPMEDFAAVATAASQLLLLILDWLLAKSATLELLALGWLEVEFELPLQIA